MGFGTGNWTEFGVYYNGTWKAPVTAAMPVSIGSQRIDLAPIVKFSIPMARAAAGFPIQVNDEMWAEVGRPKINATGLAWWFSASGASLGDAAYNSRYVVLWNPTTQLWTPYSCYMWRPEYVGGYAPYGLSEFKVRITNLVEGEP